MDLSVDNILASPQSFEQFRGEALARLQERRETRRRFLLQVQQEIPPLLDGAVSLHDSGLEALLRECLRQATEELARLPGLPEGAALVVPRPLGPEQAPELELAEEPSGPPEAASPEGSLVGAEPVVEAARDPSTEPEIGTAEADRPAAVQETSLPAPPPPPPPRWEPRPLPEIEADLGRLNGALDEDLGQGPARLLRLKALACRQRRAFQELQAHGRPTSEAKQLYLRIRDLVQAQFPDQYVIPLNSSLTTRDPFHWEALARHYDALIPAEEAMAWYLEYGGTLRAGEARRFLEAIAATQRLLHRELESHFTGQVDDQRCRLLEELRATGVYLKSLGQDRGLAALEATAATLPVLLQQHREERDRWARRDRALERVQSLVSGAEFGSREVDAAELRSAVLECLQAGIPPSNKDLRESLLPWPLLLNDDPRCSCLVKEIEKELERREKRGTLHAEEESEVELSPETQRLLEELLPHTWGKRALFIGGRPMEDKRREIQETLGLSELLWPEVKGARVYDFAPDIANTDITVLLIRFMRTAFSKAANLCQEQGRRVVRLPRGLGLPRVIQDFHNQLVPRVRNGD